MTQILNFSRELQSARVVAKVSLRMCRTTGVPVQAVLHGKE